MRTRRQVNKAIDSRLKRIEKLKEEISQLRKIDCLISDKHQRFTEEMEDVLISRRPKVINKRLVGRIHWNEFFTDEDYPDSEEKGIWIERSRIVRINGEWV